MAYTVEGVWSFFDYNDTGLDSVPLNKVLIVKSNGKLFIKKTNDGITQNTTIQQAIDAGALDAKSIGTGEGNGFDYVQEQVPTNAKQGEIWFRPSTFEIFVMEENNKWVGSKGTIIQGGQETPPSGSNQAPTAPTNTSSFPAIVAAGRQTQFIFSGSTDSDGTVQSYKVSDISDAIITCDNPVVAAGSPHIFTVGSLSESGEKSVTFKVSAIDNQGAESDKVQVTTNVQNLRVPTAPSNASSFPEIICAPGKQGSFTFTGSDIGTHYEVYDFSNKNLTVQEAKVAAGQPHVFNGVSETIRVTFKVKAISSSGIDSTPVTVTTKVEKTATQPGSQPEPGEVGFGVGLAPEDVCTKYGMTLLSNEPGNENYGNYRHNSSGSIMVWIPKFYFRITEDSSAPYYGTRFDVSFEPKSGYVIHRAFIDGGKEVPGFFIDKYHCGAENQVCVSKKGIIPTSSGSTSRYADSITNQYPSKGYSAHPQYFLDAVKTRGQEFNVITAFQMNALSILGDAYYQECYRKNKTSQIAWADVAPYQPKGNSNGLKDIEDSSVTFVQASGSYPGTSLTGSANNLAKTTHNGEKCGVADITGNIYRLGIGIKSSSGNVLQVMKESVYAKDITRSNYSSSGIYDDTTYHISSSAYRLGNLQYNPFTMSEDRNSNEYRLNCSGIPSNAMGVSKDGTARFGQDYTYISPGGYYAICGGDSNDGNVGGYWNRWVSYSMDSSNGQIGFGASLYPHMDKVVRETPEKKLKKIISNLSIKPGSEQDRPVWADDNDVFGTMGNRGAGLAYLPQEALKAGLTPLDNANSPFSDTFGNFKDAYGNVFCCVPMMYYKANKNDLISDLDNHPRITISYNPRPDFIPFYAFKKSDGSYVKCVFVAKYPMTIGTGNKASYEPNKAPVAFATLGYNALSTSLTGNGQTLAGGSLATAFSATKTTGSKYCLHYAPLRFVHYMVSRAHIIAAIEKYQGIAKVPSFICAWADRSPYYPRGNTVELQKSTGAKMTAKSTDDNTLSFSQSGVTSYGAHCLNGSCNVLSKASHNGQACGIMDLVGNMPEVDAGLINLTIDYSNSANYSKIPDMKVLIREILGVTDQSKINNLAQICTTTIKNKAPNGANEVVTEATQITGISKSDPKMVDFKERIHILCTATTNAYYILRGIDLLPKLTSTNKEDIFVNNVLHYEPLNTTGRATNTTCFGTGNSSPFAFTANGSAADSVLIPLSSGTSSSGTNTYGSDGFYPMTNGTAPMFGGQCATGYGHVSNTSYYGEIDTSGTGSKAGLLALSGSRSWAWVGSFGHHAHSNWNSNQFHLWSILCGARAIIVP